MIRLYHRRCGQRNGNFGDEVAVRIVRRLTDEPITLVGDFESADLVTIGSILQDVPPEYRGAIWGTGLMFEDRRPVLPVAHIAALRGPLTAARIVGNSCTTFCDPLVLLPRPPHQERIHRLGIIPHYIDQDDENLALFLQRCKDEDVVTIDICSGIDSVVEQVGRCKGVVSSSLHGLMLADVLGIPNRWVVFGDRVQGGSFKMRDYYATCGVSDPVPMMFDMWMHPQDYVNDLWGPHDLTSLIDNALNSFPKDWLRENQHRDEPQGEERPVVGLPDAAGTSDLLGTPGEGVGLSG